MPGPAVSVAFKIKIPTEPSIGKETFICWLQKHGRIQTDSILDADHVCTFHTNKFVRQDNLRKSILRLFHKKGIHTDAPFSLSTINLAPPKQTAEERITQIEAELKELRERPVTVTTTINQHNNNNVIILNFGNEDMSYVHPPLQYLENAFNGLHELLKDVYFNDQQPQNHTIRVNMSSKTVEISANGEWKTIALTDASKKMIDKCGFYMLSAYDSERHKENDQIMDFSCALHDTSEKGLIAPFHNEIHHQLIHRANRDHSESDSESDSEANTTIATVTVP